MPSKNNVEKKLLAVADDNKHIELEIANTLKQMFDTAVKEGFKGTFKQYQDSLSLDQLKRINLALGGEAVKEKN